MKRTKTSLLKSALALLLCVSMLIGSTFAWFTDKVTSKGNIIQSGNLDIEMYWTDDLSSGNWYNVEDDAHNTIFSYDKWEPGYTDVKYIKLVNKGNLAMNYKLTLTPQGSVGKLAEVINVFFADKAVDVQSREDLSKLGAIGLLNNVLNGGATANGTLLAKDQYSPLHPSGEVIMTIAMNMITTAGNDYQDQDSGEFTITALATQASFEKDSFGSDYDSNAEYPTIITGGTVTTQVNAVDGKVPAEGVNISGNGISAFVPGGIEMADGADSLTLSVTPMEHTTTDITVVNNEILIPVDVHISGIAAGNTTPIVIDLGEVLPKYLNMGNYHLYHVENGANSTMTLVGNEADLTEHNRFTYDPLTGAVKVAMASFSEVALVADTTNPWMGKADYDWYNTDATELNIANADQLYAFAKIVGGMAEGIKKDSFKDKTIKLLSDINLNHGNVVPEEEKENSTTKIFYPIGYYNKINDETSGYYDRVPEVEGKKGVTSSVSSFSGTFDGNGHTISNFYQNTWEMFGDYNDGYSGTPNYYKDAMGLFGYVYGGTIKNLTVDNFESDGEFTPTGVIAAYACNSTFENIAITNCEPRVYNTGNGGIVGIGGNSDDTDDYKLTFNNITIDNTNTITALWGSYDVACGGLVGMFRGAGHVYMNNCHVAAQMNVYNDVCGNYQYYWYRYSGMMVGTNKNMITDKDGYTVPETSKFHAENCTVHFGNWNDYYYCELVANSLASYTHDHQFSRLTEISSLDEIKSGDTWLKTGNFLLIKGEKQRVSGEGTCYHIMKDANGNLYEHKHNEADATNKDVYETINGETVLKENNQRIYLPFNQLFTGYGWGVKHIPVYNGKDYAFEGITILDREVANSVEKFGIAQPLAKYPSGYTVNIEELFKAIENADVNIATDKVQVFVSPADENSSAGGTYRANSTDWTKGTLTFTGSGAAKITITDYYFCTETSIDVTIVEGLLIDEFDKVLPNCDQQLYRVGDDNPIELGTLFSKLPGVSIKSSDVTITVENHKDTPNITSIYKKNTSDWTKSTSDFEGTGVIKLSIKDCTYGNACELYLEIVDAYNVTKYSDLKDDQNSVLLNNIKMSSGRTYRLTDNHVLYGNGFTFDVTDGAYNGVEYDYASYVIYLENSRIDNTIIIGKVYPELGATRSNDYNRAIVMTNGNSRITNCYISNGASPIRNGGNLELVNTTLKGGIYANLDQRNGHLILDNVTTINQIGVNDKSGETEIVGMGIVVYQEGGSEELKITIKNELKQFNYLSKTQADKYLTNTYAQQIKNVVFGNDFAAYKNGEWINFGIISMNNYFAAEDLVDERTDNANYFGTAKTVTILTQSRNCYCYSFKPTSTTPPTPTNYKTEGQGAIKPTVEFDFTTKNYVKHEEGKNDYCYADGKTVFISMDEGKSFSWDTSILTVTKHGNNLDYTVKLNGVDQTGKNITFNQSGTYSVVYSYTDSVNYTLEDGKVVTFDIAYTETVNINVTVVKPTAKNATFSFGEKGTKYNGITVIVGDKTYVMPEVTATVSGKIGSKTINGTTVYYPIVEMFTSDGKTEHSGSWYACFPIFKDALQIIDYADKGTGDGITYNQDTVTQVAEIPATLKAVDPAKTFLYSMNATNYPAPTEPYAQGGVVCYTCNRNGLDGGSNYPRKEETIVAEYTYTDNAGKVYTFYIGYHCEEQTKKECVTPDTLITLADGTQVRVDSLKGDELLLVWNLETGKYEAAPIVFVDSDAEMEYEVIHLYFSDGSDVKVISEHGFFDLDLGKYVYIDANNYADYVGHKFVAEGDIAANNWNIVTLDEVVIETEVTTAWSPVTFEHLCYYTNGVLSMPGGIEGLFNIFEVDTDTMRYDAEQMQKDIETYGLFTIEDFGGMIPEIAFDAFNGAYLKVAIGKGLLTWEDIAYMAERYIPLI